MLEHTAFEVNAPILVSYVPVARSQQNIGKELKQNAVYNCT